MAKRDKRAAAQTAAAVPEPVVETSPAAPGAPVEKWRKPAGLSPRGWAVLAAVVALVNLPLLHHLVRGQRPSVVTLPFTDDFSHPELMAERYFSTGGGGQIRSGILDSPGVRNNPLWLNAVLPADVHVRLETRTLAPEGDIRVELFGNGEDTLSGYRLVLAPSGTGVRGTLYRQSESRAIQGATLPLRNTETQHWDLERRGHVFRWTVNGALVVEYDDATLLTGPGHDRLGLSSGEWDVLYDRLSIEAAPSGPLPPLAHVSLPPLAPAAPGPVGVARTGLPAFVDTFDRPALGPDWRPTDPAAVTVDQGSLVLERAHNHPVWLTRPLPPSALIEVEVWTDSPEGDLKVEAWGDGSSAHQGDLHAAYTASGYVFVMGGWRNTRSVLVRREEHGHDGAARDDIHVEPGRHYHWRIARQGGHLRWDVDGQPFLTLDDPDPLVGPQQSYFAVSDWETRVHFDNLRITPLP